MALSPLSHPPNSKCVRRIDMRLATTAKEQANSVEYAISGHDFGA